MLRSGRTETGGSKAAHLIEVIRSNAYNVLCHRIKGRTYHQIVFSARIARIARIVLESIQAAFLNNILTPTRIMSTAKTLVSWSLLSLRTQPVAK